MEQPLQTRMHSSRMRTARSLTVCRSRSICPGGGVVRVTHAPPCMPPCHTHTQAHSQPCVSPTPLPCMPPMHTPTVHASPATHTTQATHTPTPSHARPPAMHAPSHTRPPVDRITDACENITLPQLRCGR